MLCYETAGASGGNEPDPLVTQRDGSHARSHFEQQGRGSKHHSTRGVASCVNGTGWGDVEEDLGEGAEEGPEWKHAQESRGVNVNRGPR